MSQAGHLLQTLFINDEVVSHRRDKLLHVKAKQTAQAILLASSNTTITLKSNFRLTPRPVHHKVTNGLCLCDPPHRSTNPAEVRGSQSEDKLV